MSPAAHPPSVLARLQRWLRGGPAKSVADPVDPDLPSPHSPERQATFRQALARYPAHVPPHLGFARQLSPEQTQRNLEWFVRTAPACLRALRELAALTGLALDTALAASPDAAKARTQMLIDWTNACWPDTPYRPEHTDINTWLGSARTGEDAIFSVVLDVGTLLRQTIMDGRSEWRWGLNMSRRSLRGMQALYSARRVVLTTPLLGEQRTPLQLDLEMLVLKRYSHPKDLCFRPTAADAHPWMQYVCEGYTGRVIDLTSGQPRPELPT